ncbi:MAG: class I SAM-dependent methyltransferase [Anaerolineae bacterium]|nr:class I SAM-dependent methyltransferase [Anaerolineae bacterium]
MSQPTNDVKHYFQRPGTVARWWNPEDERDPHFAHFREQLTWAMAQVAWEGQRVLDVGTGKGRFAIPCAQAGARVTAIDISGEMLAQARQRAQQAGLSPCFVQGDAEHLPFSSQAFDVVSCMESLMHVPHPQQAVAEAARVVRPGGQTIFSMTNKWRINALANLPQACARALRLNRSPAGPQIAWYYSTRTFRRWLQQAGLRVCLLRGQGLFQAGARLAFTRRFSIPLFPRAFADWFFARIEPRLRQSPLLHVMGTVMAIAVAEEP